uniref:Collectin subfamily member 10 n=1 Tax=Naja naja TaxID=35670 RepID=A0A8C6Y9P9_NAJNA
MIDLFHHFWYYRKGFFQASGRPKKASNQPGEKINCENYREALAHCRIREGILAMPKDEAANTVISDYVSQSGFFRVFIGLNDIEKEGQFMYADGTPLQSYSNWKDGVPQDTQENEDCVEMLSTGKWNDTECHLTMYFICEFPKRRT